MKILPSVLIIVSLVLVVIAPTQAHATVVDVVHCDKEHFFLSLPPSWRIAHSCSVSGVPPSQSGLTITSRDSKAGVYFNINIGTMSLATMKKWDTDGIFGTLLAPEKFGYRDINGVRYLTDTYQDKESEGVVENWLISAIHRGDVYLFTGLVVLSANRNISVQRRQVQQVLASIHLN